MFGTTNFCGLFHLRNGIWTPKD